MGNTTEGHVLNPPEPDRDVQRADDEATPRTIGDYG